MKKFLKKVLIYFLVTVSVCFIPSIVVDPFNVFHPLNARWNTVEPNKNYIKMHYVLHNPDKYDSFVMGSSHVAMINVDYLPGNAYNMYYSSGIPAENLASLNTLVKNGIVPERIYLGFDNISFTESYDEHTREQLRSPYEYSKSNPLDFWMLYLDPVVNLQSVVFLLKNVGTNVFQPYDESLYTHGGVISYGEKDEINIEEAKSDAHKTYCEMTEYLEGISNYPLSARNTDSVVSSIKGIKAICDEYGIDLTVFIAPMYFAEFSKSVRNDALLSVMRQVAQITPYYSFCGYNKYTTDVKYYYSDRQHFSSDLCDVLIDCFINGKVDEEAYSQGFGVYVTEDNIEELISLITDPTAKW